MQRKNGYLFTLEIVEKDIRFIKDRIKKFYFNESNSSFSFLVTQDSLFQNILETKSIFFLPEDLYVEKFEEFFEFGDGHLYYYKEKDILKIIRHEKNLVIQTKKFYTDKKFNIFYSDLKKKILQDNHLKNFKIFLKDLELSQEENENNLINFLKNLGKIIIRDRSLVGCNLLLYGPPGTGKSPFIRKLTEHI